MHDFAFELVNPRKLGREALLIAVVTRTHEQKIARKFINSIGNFVKHRKRPRIAQCRPLCFRDVLVVTNLFGEIVFFDRLG